MIFERSSLRYAHTTGYTSLIYTEHSGEFIVTCGSDGDIRRWVSIDDDDPTSSCLGECVICLAHQNNRLLASTDRNTVQAYTFPAIDNDGVLMRFTAPVTCIRATNKYIAAGSEDTDVRVQSENKQDPELHLKGHTGPLLAIDISPKEPLLASIAGDGHLKVWNLETGTEVKCIVGSPKVNSFESALCFGTPVFEPRHGNFLAYVKGQEVCVLSTSNWELQFNLVDENIKGYYTCCSFSSDGQYLAAGTTTGEISVFDFMRKLPVNCEAPSSECQAITCLAWKPNNNKELAYCDASGQLGTLFSNAGIMHNSALATVADAPMDFGEIEFGDDLQKDNYDDEDRDQLGNNDDGDDDNNDDAAVSIEKLKRKIMQGNNVESAIDDDTRDSITSADTPAIIAKTFKMQSAFQPSSTPTRLEHRYLVWNEIGIVTLHADSADGSIDVEFHDASVHHALHIPNYNNYDMASLSSSALLLAGENATKFVCIALAASGNREWNMQLPDCESVVALAASAKLIGVVTSSHFLRLFTVMGTQREIITIPGPVVAMAGYEDRLIICYHSAPASELQQHISAMLVQANGLQLRTQQLPLTLPPERQLTWLGFSDTGSPVFADSMGLVQLFSIKSNCWYPICDTLKQSQSVSNNYFIIGISEKQQIVQAVLCRGTSYPMTNPRPMMQELPMHLPICDVENEKAELEDTLLRASFMAMDNAEKTTKETAIKLFALACRSEMEARAKELIEAIACPDILQLAVKYATKSGRIHLSDRLYNLLPQIEIAKAEQPLFDIDQHLPVTPLVQQQISGTANNDSLIIASKLAPKTMDLQNIRRSSLKRLSTSGNSGLKRTSSLIQQNESESLSNDTEISNDNTQENMYTEKEKINDTLDSTKEFVRTPLNSVNPFAAKRKISEVEAGQKNGILMGANKLKIAKKSN